MIFIIFLLLLVIVTIKYYFLQKQVKQTTKQLSKNQKATIHYPSKHFEQLAIQINKQMDKTKEVKKEQRHTERELKHAISHISHDIRTPLTSLSGYVQLLEQEDLSEKQRQAYVQTIKYSANRLKVLLEDFFFLSIIEQADFPMELEQIKLHELVPEVLLGFYEGLKEKNLIPNVQLPDGEVHVIGDISAMKRVVENLVGNAVKYGEGEIIIQLHAKEKEVELAIANRVSGLTEEDVLHLFDRFYKGDKARAGESSGLGLAIAKNLVEKMNGTLTAELCNDQLWMRCIWRGETS